ncbi:MAG: hypothetical protein KDK70_40750, partial [Myxococcales bacterium]|nr:hypothetical protein [Myxococcales bacterium]
MRVRAVLGLGSWLLGMGSGCGPTVQGDPSSDDGTSTPTSGTTTSTEDVTTMTTSPTTTGPMTTTEGLDDGPRLDLPTDVGMEECVDWATMGCGIPGPRGVVTAMTPQGDFETTVAVFGGMIGCGGWCPGALSPNLQRIVLASSPAMLQDLQPFDLVDETLAIEFDVFEGPLGVPVPARLWASRDGQSSSAEGAEVVMDLLPTAEEVSEPF